MKLKILYLKARHILSVILYKINSSDVLYDRNINRISSNELTTVADHNKNKFVFNKGLNLT